MPTIARKFHAVTNVMDAAMPETEAESETEAGTRTVVDRFLAEQKYKCKRLIEENLKAAEDTMARIKRGSGLESQANASSPHRCPPFFDGLLCWPRTFASKTAILPCPPFDAENSNAILGSDSRTVATATKFCLSNGQWYKNTDQVSWGNYSLCARVPVLLDTWLPIIKTVSQIGYASSFITLIVAMVIFSLLRKLRNPRNRLHMHLFASFIMRAFMALLKDWIFVDGIGLASDVVFVDGKNAFMKKQNMWICKAITSVWQYFIVANYSWILMEGLYLHNLVFLAFCADSTAITLYTILGWGIPVAVVVPWIIIRATIEDTLCWTTHNNPSLFLVIRIPIMISILFNFLLFVNIVRVLFIKFKTSVHLQRKKMQYSRWAKSTLVLVPLFGAHYTLFLGLSYHRDHRVELVWLFCDQLFASFQGCFVALLYCLLNIEVRTEVKRVWTARSKRNLPAVISDHRQLSKRGMNPCRRQSPHSDHPTLTDRPF